MNFRPLSGPRLFGVTSLALLSGLALSRAAHAEPQPSIDVRRFTPAVDPNATLYLEPTSTEGSRNPHVAGWLSLAHRPVTLKQNGEVAGRLIKEQLSLDTVASVGVGKRGQVGLALPVVLAQSSDDNAATRQVLEGGAMQARGVGDLALVGKANLVKMQEMGGLGLSFVARATLPTGDRTSGVGEGAPTSELRVLGEYKLVAVAAQGTLGYKLRIEERTFGGRTFGDEIPWGLGFTVKPQALGWDRKGHWTFGGEAHGWLPAGPTAPFGSVALSGAFVGGTARYQARDLSLTGGLEAGVVHGVGVPPARAVIGVGWAPREHDLDHDGIDDDHDECVGLAEDKDGFEDGDGCPEMDNDDDGVLDPDDKCPTQKEDEDGFEDDDGCPDPDNDKDGVLDVADACPNEAGPPNVDPKKNGCPDRDPDHDGIGGDADKCPMQPEDKDGFEDDDGCPDPDNDQDGIMDADDACPNDKGEPSSDPKLRGCPSPDRDRDGIANDADRCPDQPETYNGFEDEDGCPDTGKPADKPLVELREKKGEHELFVRKPIAFAAKDSPELDKASLATVRAVAEILGAHRGASIEIAVRPRPGAEDLARSRASAITEALRRATFRTESAVAIAWEKGKMPQQAEVSGILVRIKGIEPKK